jgi:hypothetical protein
MAETVTNASTHYELPECLHATVSSSGRPVSGLFVRVRIATSRKNDFANGFGPSDAAGNISVTREDLLREAERDRNLFIMDYGHPEHDYAGCIDVTPMNREALIRALDAYHQFQVASEFPPLYPEHLQEARLILEGLAPAVLCVELSVEGGSGRVMAERIEA